MSTTTSWNLFRHSLDSYGVYGLFIQQQFPHNLSYGMQKLEVSDASIIAVEVRISVWW
ncbi:MAG: hypothetical protein J6Y38_06130 [Bacteroidaceae bacterium]|nr:hypothetical protein [Bacteroidaceae bacterium]